MQFHLDFVSALFGGLCPVRLRAAARLQKNMVGGMMT